MTWSWDFCCISENHATVMRFKKSLMTISMKIKLRSIKYKFMELKDLWVSPQTPKIFWKKFSKTFGKMRFHCIFCKSICDIFKAFHWGKVSRSDGWGIFLNTNYVFHIIYFLIFPSSDSLRSPPSPERRL